MIVFAALGIAAILALVFGPGLWARSILRRHAAHRPDIPGTGGELAEHLVRTLGLPGVRVEQITDRGDHYDPQAKAVRLQPEHFRGRSLSAVVVAAHEVGHALQDAAGYRPLKARQALVASAQTAERLGAGLMMALPLVAGVTLAPGVALLNIVAGALALGAPLVVHLVTLPVEWDASFRRALPVLQRGGYLSRRDLPAARHILRACALTYVAGSLASLLNLARWARILFRR